LFNITAVGCIASRNMSFSVRIKNVISHFSVKIQRRNVTDTNYLLPPTQSCRWRNYVDKWGRIATRSDGRTLTIKIFFVYNIL
jgi:hypothetical protein